MKLVKTALLTAMVTSLSACVIVVDAKNGRADVETIKSLSLDASNIQELDIEAGAGTLDIIGKPGLSAIKVEAKVYTTSDEPDSYELTLKQQGSSAYLVAKSDSSGFYIGNSPHIDVTVYVPQNLKLDVDDGSGDLYISDINNSVTIEDGSGRAFVENIQGNLNIDDGSGELIVKQVTGNVDIDDGSGDAYISNVTGSISVNDGSGELDITTVRGMVTINDGSGDITISDADALTVEEAGSGDLNIKRVGNVNTRN